MNTGEYTWVCLGTLFVIRFISIDFFFKNSDRKNIVFEIPSNDNAQR